MTVPPVIEFSKVSFRYEDQPVLKEVSLTVPEGDFLGIVGPNGGGKTTLLRIILGLISPDSGSVKVLGNPPHSVQGSVGYVPQQLQFDRDFPVSVMDVVLMGRLSQARYIGGFRAADREAARNALDAVEMYAYRRQRLAALSGGERQRVLIARALVSQPRLLLLDEPTASVDTRVERDIYELLERLNAQTTIVLVTHDLAFVSSYVKRVACLNRTLICHPTTRLSAEVIEELYEGPIRLVQHRHRLGEAESDG